MPTITQEYEAARKANEERYAQAMQIYDEIVSRYRPGGAFQAAQFGELEKQKARDIGAETQQLISGGLFGTSVTAGLPRKWEAEVGAPARLKLEDIMMQRLSQAQIGKAGFMERREDVYPDVGAYAGYAGQRAAAQTQPAPYRSTSPGPLERSRMLFGGATTPTATAAAAPTGGRTPTTVTPTAEPTEYPEIRPLEEIMGGVSFTPPTPQQTGMTTEYQEYASAVKSKTPTAKVISQSEWQRRGRPSASTYLARYK